MMAKLFAMALFLMPLTGDRWIHLPFEKIEPNLVDHRDGRLTIQVEGSASALLGKLTEGTRVSRLEVTGTFTGRLDLPEDRLWIKGYDDAILRVGVIESGDQRLSALQRSLAPDWLRQVEDQFRDTGNGVGIIHCAELMPEPGWVGKSRINPAAKLFHEKIVAAPGEDGRFHLVAEFDPPIAALGLWLQADGDDTGSSFTVVIDGLSIKGAED